MCWVSNLANLRLHDPQRTRPDAELLSCSGTVPQNIVACEHRHLFFENAASVILSMARRVHRSQRSAFDREDAAVRYAVLRLAGDVFEDRISEMRMQSKKIWYASSVIAVPVCEDDVREHRIQLRERTRYQCCPFRHALTCIYEQCLQVCNNNGGVRSLQSEFACILAQDTGRK